jgi:hypothetical protein
MKRIVIGVLAMLVVLPALDLGSGVLGERPNLAVGGLAMLHHTALAEGARNCTPGGSSSSSSAFVDAMQVGAAQGKGGGMLLGRGRRPVLGSSNRRCLCLSFTGRTACTTTLTSSEGPCPSLLRAAGIPGPRYLPPRCPAHWLAARAGRCQRHLRHATC